MSVQGPGQAVPPNWYPDPRDPRFLRYWTGTQWTEHTSPTATAGTPPMPSGSGGGSKKVVWIVLAAVVVVLLVVGIILAAVAIPAFLSQRADEADLSATADVSTLVMEAEEADLSATVDVSTLAMELATWYVDHNGPPPPVESSDGQYYVDGYPVAAVASGVVLGGVTGTGSSDWCVWVTNREGDLKSFEYSARYGLQAGTC